MSLSLGLMTKMIRAAEPFGINVRISEDWERLEFLGPTGLHSLDLLVTDDDRALAHLRGFVENQPKPPIIRLAPYEGDGCPIGYCPERTAPFSLKEADGYADCCRRHAPSVLFDLLWDGAMHVPAH